MKEVVASVIPVEKVRYFAFSHVEACECNSLNERLAVVPQAEPFCSIVAAMVSVQDPADQPPRTLADVEILPLGSTLYSGMTLHIFLMTGVAAFFQSKLRKRYCVATFSYRGVLVILHSQSQISLDLATHFVRQWTIFLVQKIQLC